MNNIDNILNRYFAGDSTLEEEKTLKAYFAGNNVLPRHETYRPLFAAFAHEKQMKAPEIGLPKAEKKKPAVTRRIIIALAGAAAVAMLVFALLPTNRTQRQHTEYVVIVNGKQIKNPQAAKAYAHKMFSEAEAIIRASYAPLVEAKTMQSEMDAELIFNNLDKKIDNMESEIINF